ncbi:unnamed protein product [Natator depressus]
MAATEGADLLMEPLIHNLHLCVQVAEPPSVCQSLVLAEVTRIGDLLDYDYDSYVLSWHMRLLHVAMSTGMYLARFTPLPDACGVRETLAHVYLQCARLQPLFRLLQNLLLRFWLHFSLHLFTYAYPIRGPTKSQDYLINLLLAMAKVAIYNTRKRRLAGGWKGCNCGTCFHSFIRPRIRAASTGFLDAFEEQWALSGVSPSRSLVLAL